MTNIDDVATSPALLLPLAEAASRLGLHQAALRSRIRRGLVTAKKGNDRRLLVEVPADAQPRHDVAMASPDVELAAEVAELRERLARAEAAVETAKAVAEARMEAALASADGRVSAARAEAKAVRELCDRLTAELLDARRPWWRRMLG